MSSIVADVLPVASRPKKHFWNFRTPLVEYPNFVEPQVVSYAAFLKGGLQAIFKDFSPIKDYSGKKFELEFKEVSIGESPHDEHSAKARKASYEAPLKARVLLRNKIAGTEKEQEIFLADIPLQTAHGTFIISGVERVIVPQLARSFGVFFTAEEAKGRPYFGAKIIPARGAWLEIDADPDGGLYARIDRKRKFPVSSLLRIMGASTDQDITALFAGNPAAALMAATCTKDHAKDAAHAYTEIYKRLRDGETATPDTARAFVSSIFDVERYNLSKVGRVRFNTRFGKTLTPK